MKILLVKHWVKLFLIIILLSISFYSFAAPVYRIGVIEEAPFSFYKNNQLSGIAVNLWEKIAQVAGITYRYQRFGDQYAKAFQALKNNKIDALIGPISVQNSYIGKFSFSRPYYINKLAIVTQRSAGSSFLSTLKYIAPWTSIFMTLSFFIIATLIFSILIWLIEYRKKDSDLRSFPENIWNGFSALCSLNFIKNPSTPLSRILFILWLLFSLTFISLFTATITSSMTISQSNLQLAQYKGHGVFANQSMATIAGSFAEYFAKILGANIVPVDNYSQAIELLESGRVSAIVGNQLTLKYFLKYHPKHENIEESIVGVNELAFVFRLNSPLRDIVDHGLTYLQDHNQSWGICAKVVGQEDARNCLI